MRMAWKNVADRQVLARRQWMEIEAGPAALLLFDLDGQVYATAAICPHHAAWLFQGSITEDCVDCPRHMGRFHIPSGEQRRGPACGALRTYPCRIEGDRVLVDI